MPDIRHLAPAEQRQPLLVLAAEGPLRAPSPPESRAPLLLVSPPRRAAAGTAVRISGEAAGPCEPVLTYDGALTCKEVKCGPAGPKSWASFIAALAPVAVTPTRKPPSRWPAPVEVQRKPERIRPLAAIAGALQGRLRTRSLS